MKQRLTLWHDSRPLSSRPRRILCFMRLELMEDMHFSSCLFNFSFTHMQMKMAAAFITSHATPHAKSSTPCQCEIGTLITGNEKLKKVPAWSCTGERLMVKMGEINQVTWKPEKRRQRRIVNAVAIQMTRILL